MIAGLAQSSKTKASRVIIAAAGRKELERLAERAKQFQKLSLGNCVLLGTPQEYVSKDAFEKFLAQKKLSEVEVQLAAKLLLWLPVTKTGYLHELTLTWEENLASSAVTSRTHACSKIAEPQKCSYCAALQHSIKAKVVLVSHHTLLDLLQQELLEVTDALIIDDGQYLEDAATEALGVVVHQGSLERALPSNAEGEKLRSQLTLVAGLVGVFLEKARAQDTWAGVRTVVLGAQDVSEPEYKRVRSGLEKTAEKLSDLNDAVIKTQLDALEKFLRADPAEDVIQIQLNEHQQFVLRSQPVEVRAFLSHKLFKRKGSVVILGPRLTVAQGFSYLKSRLGIPDDTPEVILPSPKGLADKTAIVSLINHPEMLDNRWADQTGRVIARAAQVLRGPVLAVFSSRNSILGVHGVVESLLAGTDIKLLAQGLSGGRGKAVLTMSRQKQAVLLATYTFIERTTFRHGFKAVILVRLPFAVPTEPLGAARKARLSSGFRELELPRVAIKVREQFDRLLESADDRGVLIVLDQKFQKEYANVFMRTLPAVPTHAIPSDQLDEAMAPYANSAVDKQDQS